MTITFFLNVTDTGSWLEIGSTITHFAIASLMCVFVAALEGVSPLFIAGVEVNNSQELIGAGNGKAPETPIETANGEKNDQNSAPISAEK